MIEAVEVLTTTPGVELPDPARERLGLGLDQHNILLRVVLRALDPTRAAKEANHLRDGVYAALHRGAVHRWACVHPPR